jgi:hypothetical protein
MLGTIYPSRWHEERKKRVSMPNLYMPENSFNFFLVWYASNFLLKSGFLPAMDIVLFHTFQTSPSEYYGDNYVNRTNASRPFGKQP